MIEKNNLKCVLHTLVRGMNFFSDLKKQICLHHDYG